MKRGEVAQLREALEKVRALRDYAESEVRDAAAGANLAGEADNGGWLIECEVRRAAFQIVQRRLDAALASVDAAVPAGFAKEEDCAHNEDAADCAIGCANSKEDG